MAFKTNETDYPLSEVYTRILNAAGSVKRNATALHDASLAGPVEWRRIINDHDTLERYRAIMAGLKTATGLVNYVQNLYPDDATYDVVTEYNTMEAQLIQTRDWIQANIPLNNPGSFVDNVFQETTYPPVVTSALRVRLTALLATLD